MFQYGMLGEQIGDLAISPNSDMEFMCPHASSPLSPQQGWEDPMGQQQLRLQLRLVALVVQRLLQESAARSKRRVEGCSSRLLSWMP